MSQDQSMVVTLHASPASDSWGFVGVVCVGEFEAYRTIRAYTTPAEAMRTAQHLLAEVLGALMAGQEWRMAETQVGHAPRRTELGFGLGVRRGSVFESTPTEVEGIEQHGGPPGTVSRA